MWLTLWHWTEGCGILDIHEQGIRKEIVMKGIRFALAGLLLLLVVWVKLEDMRKTE
jgi:hypothetical protein